MTTVDYVRYRRATANDVPAMAACRMPDTDAGAADERMTAYFDGLHHPQQALLPRVGYAAFAGDTLVGYIAGHLTLRYGYDGEVQYLYVAPEHRRRRVASALLRLLVGWFQEHGVTRVCVNANPDSPPAVPFYTSQGASPLNRYWYVWKDAGSIPEAGVPR
jgi:GNAT superfamily N-acetyltransferase